MTNTTSTNRTILANVKIEKTHAYRKSYANYNDVLEYPFAEIKGNWIICYDKLGREYEKHLMTAKHFNGYTFKSEITERAFRMRTKKNRQTEAERKAKIEAEKEAERIAYLQKIEEYQNSLKTRVVEKIEAVREVITLNVIRKRLNGDMSSNEVCNRAVGVVGYDYAKMCGWMNVLREIQNQY